MQVLTGQSIKDEIRRTCDIMFYKGGKTEEDHIKGWLTVSCASE